nr:MAG TPA: hypothetical protein [Caudoviricetes sp.]
MNAKKMKKIRQSAAKPEKEGSTTTGSCQATAK